MSIEKMDGSGDKVWVHQKKGENQGFPGNDWASFYTRLCTGMKEVNGSGTACSNLEHSSEGSSKLVSSILAMGMISAATVF